MKILVMCGGRGKRLGDITDSIPKPLVKLKGKPILAWTVEHYISQGFKEFVFCLGYKGDQIRAALGKYRSAANFAFSDAGLNAGILKRLDSAREMLSDQVFMVYGDTYTKIDLTEVIRAHQKANDLATIITAPIQNPFGLIQTDTTHKKITSFKEKPVLKYYIGSALINKDALDIISSSIVNLPDGEGLIAFYQELIINKLLGNYTYEGLQITFNTKDELKKAEEAIQNFYTVNEKS